jgi:hypothetical protein
MEDSMAVDVVLWFILAGMAAWIICGCVLTTPRNKRAKPYDDALEQRFNRAA